MSPKPQASAKTTKPKRTRKGPPLSPDDLALQHAKVSEIIDLASLKPHPRNYRDHPESELAHIIASITEHGFYRNVTIASDGTILCGHGVVLASLRMGLTQGPVYRLPIGPDDPRALKILAGDNEISSLGERDDSKLIELFKSIGPLDDEMLLGTGFDSESLDKLVGKSVISDPIVKPKEFKSFDESIPVEHQCPKCGYKWSGGKIEPESEPEDD